jgi:hypothetical protein
MRGGPKEVECLQLARRTCHFVAVADAEDELQIGIDTYLM